MSSVIDFEQMISARARSIDVSGIRRVFELGANLTDPINLSIGQPHFTVPDAIKQATVEAVQADRNGYTLTQGAPELLDAVSRRLAADVGWTTPSDDLGLMITCGTSGAILLACLALLDPGDEIVLPDPYFVIYPAMGAITGAKIVYCDTYPDFRMTAERVAACMTDRTKIVLVDSPGNPSGIVLNDEEMRDLAAMCEKKGVLLISDEIYDAFTYADSLVDGACPSPARHSQRMLLVRGFGKTYGCTGWRLGYAAGPRPLITQMLKLQQYTFVCAPSMAQVGVSVCYDDVDMGAHVAAYQRKRDMVLEAFAPVSPIVHPGGAFYAFVPVPEALGITGTEFAERAIEHNVLVIPGGVFSERDTHFRISYAAPDDRLAAGLDVLTRLARGG